MRVRRPFAYPLFLLATFAALAASHAPLLKLPYFWD